jgi:hypothetical protein
VKSSAHFSENEERSKETVVDMADSSWEDIKAIGGLRCCDAQTERLRPYLYESAVPTWRESEETARGVAAAVRSAGGADAEAAADVSFPFSFNFQLSTFNLPSSLTDLIFGHFILLVLARRIQVLNCAPSPRYGEFIERPGGDGRANASPGGTETANACGRRASMLRSQVPISEPTSMTPTLACP